MGALIVLTVSIFGGQVHGADLSDMRRLISKAPLVCGAFTQQKFLKALTRPLVSSGTVIFSVDKGVLWQVTEPFPARVLVTSDALIRWDENGNPTRSGFGRSPHFRALSDVFQAVFGSATVRLADTFNVDVAATPTDWRLGLVPRDPAFAKRIARVDVSGARFVRELQLEEGRGDRTLITFPKLTDAGCRLTDVEKRYFAG